MESLGGSDSYFSYIGDRGNGVSCLEKDVEKKDTSILSLSNVWIYNLHLCRKAIKESKKMTKERIKKGKEECGVKKRTGKRRKVSASFTVEMSVLMPMILFLIMGCILAAFYYHDKSILSGAAYETAVVGSTKMREKNGIKEEELEALLKERIRGKCILMTEVKTSVDISKKEIKIDASVSRGKMRIEVVKAAAVTEPEKQIRKKRRMGGWEWSEKLP